MPFPQVNTGLLLTGLTPVAEAGAAYTASHGQLVEYTPTADSILTLPAASLGGLVAVINLAAYTVTVKTAEAASNHIQGVSGATGYVIPSGGTAASATQAVFVSDGTNWWCVSR